MKTYMLVIAAIGLAACANDEGASAGPESPTAIPVRPELSKLDRGELEQYFLTYENTPQRDEMDAWLRKHDMEIFRTSEGEIGVGYGISGQLYSDTDDFDALFRTDTPVAKEIAGALYQPDDPKSLGRCIQEWRHRGGTVPKTVRYHEVYHVEARDGVGRVARVDVRDWPEGLDDELERCIVERRVGRTWDASKDYAFKLEGGGFIPKEEGGTCVVEE